MKEKISAHAVSSHTFTHGEGPIWDEKTQFLYWVNIEGQQVLRKKLPQGAIETHTFNERPCALVCTMDEQLLIAFADGLAYYTWNGSEPSYIQQIEPELAVTRCNDGKCDPSGRFWIGTMDEKTNQPLGALYRFDANAQLQKIISGVAVSNGLAWFDGTMFFIDSATQEIAAYPYDEVSGDIDLAARRVVTKIHREGVFPDGMTVDEAGNIWVALWGGGAVVCYDSQNGEELQRIEIPVTNVTSCCFAGPELRDLYITTAGGPLFMAKLKTRGVPSPRYQYIRISAA